MHSHTFIESGCDTRTMITPCKVNKLDERWQILSSVKTDVVCISVICSTQWAASVIYSSTVQPEFTHSIFKI